MYHVSAEGVDEHMINVHYYYFHLHALFDGYIQIYPREVLFCFKFELLRAQPCWFALHQ